MLNIDWTPLITNYSTQLNNTMTPATDIQLIQTRFVGTPDVDARLTTGARMRVLVTFVWIATARFTARQTRRRIDVHEAAVVAEDTRL